jgi:carbamoyltransferase
LSRNGAKKEDIAAGVQAFLETRVLADIKLLQSRNQLKPKLAIAGGVFANVKLNQRIWETGFFTDFFVQPAMDDAGTGLGAAASALTEMNSHESLDQIVYLGKMQNSAQIQVAIVGSRTKVISTDNIGSECAKLLNQGSILGVYNGRTEWGPRALGNRSIIASAFLEEIPGLLNKRLKRSDFMPFAPIIRDIDADKVFENYTNRLKASRFMTVTLNVRDEFKKLIPSVVHLDGTARPQVLQREDNPVVYDILDGVAIKYGIGIALNTSFNMHELPILDSVEVALHNLSIGAIDYLLVNERHLLIAQES